MSLPHWPTAVWAVVGIVAVVVVYHFCFHRSK